LGKNKTKLASYKLSIGERKIEQFFDTQLIFKTTTNCTYQYLLYWKYRPNKEFLRGLVKNDYMQHGTSQQKNAGKSQKYIP
jgi:hypothetical protein